MKPAWLKKRILLSPEVAETESAVRDLGLQTVCASAACPNRHECFNRKVATFLILGPVCTRRCGFCAVARGVPRAPDPTEPGRVAAAARRLGLRYVVVTSVTRDDLPDGGAGAFAAVIAAVRRENEGARVEVLTPDFGGDPALVRVVAAAKPDVFNHNLETVPRLYGRVRPGADYRRSLAVLRAAREAGLALTKSGLMLGLGETRAEVLKALGDLRRAGCLILTLGQYLCPGRGRLPVTRYLPPGEFAGYEAAARALGFTAVAAGPFVRSSYFAEEVFRSLPG